MEKLQNVVQVGSLREWEEVNSGDAWLLLYKKGSEQSDCAIDNYTNAKTENSSNKRFSADVNEVKDIHPLYGITSVPTLLQFRNTQLLNVVKGCHTANQFESWLNNDIFVSAEKSGGKPAKRVTVYSTPTCSWCTTLKRYLDDHHVRYTDIDVSRDQKAAEAMVRKSGQQGVPQTEINGQIIFGFDRTRINKLLEINN